MLRVSRTRTHVCACVYINMPTHIPIRLSTDREHRRDRAPSKHFYRWHILTTAMIPLMPLPAASRQPPAASSMMVHFFSCRRHSLTDKTDRTHIHPHAYASARQRGHIYLCACVPAHTCAYVHTHTHTHTSGWLSDGPTRSTRRPRSHLCNFFLRDEQTRGRWQVAPK